MVVDSSGAGTGIVGDPLPADLLAHLALSPATALQIAEQLRVARAWWVDPAGAWWRFDGREQLDNDAASRAPHVTPVAHVFYADGAWHGEVYGESIGVTYGDGESARVAVDGVLRDLGTILVQR